MNTVRTLEAFKKELMNYAYFRVMQAYVSSWVIGRPQIVSPTHSSSSESPEQIIAQVSWSLPVITGSKDRFFPTFYPPTLRNWAVLRQQKVMDFFLEAKTWVADSAKSKSWATLEGFC